MNTDELRARVLEAFAAMGVGVSLGEPGEHGLAASTPITGEALFNEGLSKAQSLSVVCASTEDNHGICHKRLDPVDVLMKTSL